MATGGERTVRGTGDGSTLTVIDAGFARIGGFICWENFMPLARPLREEEGILFHLEVDVTPRAPVRFARLAGEPEVNRA